MAVKRYPPRPGRYRCYMCGKTKDGTMFHKDCCRYNGRSSRCKACEQARYRKKSEPILAEGVSTVTLIIEGNER